MRSINDVNLAKFLVEVCGYCMGRCVGIVWVGAWVLYGLVCGCCMGQCIDMDIPRCVDMDRCVGIVWVGALIWMLLGVLIWVHVGIVWVGVSLLYGLMRMGAGADVIRSHPYECPILPPIGRCI